MYDKKESNRKYREKHRDYLIAYMKAWRKKNRIHIQDYYKDYQPKWRKANPAKVKELRKRTRDKVRDDVLTAYGYRCQCCGITTREFLSIDHMDGNGRKHRRENG